ncbi:MAG: hypothetical protein CVU78_05065 [Elusimicrobia bacterium HGW-Elusimicrobia-2]|nr:MAG: hypothetical protein CVU78_05065 [Elusimicrobia bacterium HGW-Elusimicrobia-2]
MSRYIPRQIEDTCLRRIKSGLITAILGARQVGKTTLLIKLGEIAAARGIVSKERIFYYSLDDPMLRAEIKKDFRFLEKELEKSLGEQISKIKKPILLIIDEAQKSPDIFEWIKIIYDCHRKNIKILISGSSSLGIRKKSAESLAGRITFLKLFPFTLREIITESTGINLPPPLWREFPRKKIKNYFLSRQALLYRQKILLNKLLERILIEGTLPAVYTSKLCDEKQLRLSSIVSTYLEKDIRALGEVGSFDDYSNLLKTLSFEIGSMLNLNHLSSELGIAYNTVKKYVSILKETFILNPLSPLFACARKKVVKSSKMYFFDVGIANFLSKRTAKEHIKDAAGGFLFENVLIKSYESENANRSMPGDMRFWRDYEGHEIDLVINDGDGANIPVEICRNKIFPREKLRNYYSFFTSAPGGKKSPFGIFIYQGDVGMEKIDKRPVYLIPWWLWW